MLRPLLMDMNLQDEKTSCSCRNNSAVRPYWHTAYQIKLSLSKEPGIL